MHPSAVLTKSSHTGKWLVRPGVLRFNDVEGFGLRARTQKKMTDPCPPTAPRRSAQTRGGPPGTGPKQRGAPAAKRARAVQPPRFAALDLGTNNCRLLIAAPRGRGFRIVDAFSRIVRLGENLSSTGALSAAAMDRTIEVLKICRDKMIARGVTASRSVATQACRGASNGTQFLERAAKEAGIHLEVIGPGEEARLAMVGCQDLFDPEASAALVFDIGGGSTELAWATLSKVQGSLRARSDMANWCSFPFGVVSLAEEFNGRSLPKRAYLDIAERVAETLQAQGDPGGLLPVFRSGNAHLLGTSGTVTSIAGVYLALDRYRRTAVDGIWLTRETIADVSDRLLSMSFEQRASEPCIGEERADLVVCGCAILDGIMKVWPTDRIRVADRGLREGILSELARQS